jgi:hypothetical protein
MILIKKNINKQDSGDYILLSIINNYLGFILVLTEENLKKLIFFI